MRHIPPRPSCPQWDLAAPWIADPQFSQCLVPDMVPPSSCITRPLPPAIHRSRSYPSSSAAPTFHSRPSVIKDIDNETEQPDRSHGDHDKMFPQRYPDDDRHALTPEPRQSPTAEEHTEPAQSPDRLYPKAHDRGHKLYIRTGEYEDGTWGNLPGHAQRRCRISQSHELLCNRDILGTAIRRPARRIRESFTLMRFEPTAGIWTRPDQDGLVHPRLHHA